MAAHEKRIGRLHQRILRIWHVDYLHHRYLWRNIEELVRQALALSGQRRLMVLDIGCGHKPYRELFQNCAYLGVDHGSVDTSADVVANACSLPVQDSSVDLVLTTQTLEHVPTPHAMVAEIARVLRPGGRLILTAPFFWPLHEEPYDFFRYTKHGLNSMLAAEGLVVQDIRADGGDWAQMFLSIALRLSPLWLAPARAVVNLIGSALDRCFYSERIPANYSLLAMRSRRPDLAAGCCRADGEVAVAACSTGDQRS